MADKVQEWQSSFWSKVVKTKTCWIWKGCLDKDGYGKFAYSENGRRVFARSHRLAYELLEGPIPDGLSVDHTCRIVFCVNPSHLDIVTVAENSKRSHAHHRYRKFPVSTEDLNYILSSPKTNKDIALEFSVHPTTICKIRRGQRRANG